MWHTSFFADADSWLLLVVCPGLRRDDGCGEVGGDTIVGRAGTVTDLKNF
jgi:hypothetical protein